MITVVLVIHLLIATAMVGVILIQRSEGGALSGLGGGTMGGMMTARGTANLLTRATAILAGCFIATSLVLAILAGHASVAARSSTRRRPAPAAATAPASPAARAARGARGADRAVGRHGGSPALANGAAGAAQTAWGRPMKRFVFITGGVVSSLGKGLAAAALGSLLQLRGYRVRLRKLDPYLNVDPGTMSPYQHGEVFVTDDGAETDLDLGHYERFTGVPARASDTVSAGRIYWTVLTRERHGDYLGGTVQVIPHVTNAIKEFIENDTEAADIVLCEIGGTVGDIEGLPFFEAIRQFGARARAAASAASSTSPWCRGSPRRRSSRPSPPSIRWRHCGRSASSPTSCSAAPTARSPRTRGARSPCSARCGRKR